MFTIRVIFHKNLKDKYKVAHTYSDNKFKAIKKQVGVLGSAVISGRNVSVDVDSNVF